MSNSQLFALSFYFVPIISYIISMFIFGRKFLIEEDDSMEIVFLILPLFNWFIFISIFAYIWEIIVQKLKLVNTKTYISIIPIFVFLSCLLINFLIN